MSLRRRCGLLDEQGRNFARVVGEFATRGSGRGGRSGRCEARRCVAAVVGRGDHRRRAVEAMEVGRAERGEVGLAEGGPFETAPWWGRFGGAEMAETSQEGRFTGAVGGHSSAGGLPPRQRRCESRLLVGGEGEATPTAPPEVQLLAPALRNSCALPGHLSDGRGRDPRAPRARRREEGARRRRRRCRRRAAEPGEHDGRQHRRVSSAAPAPGLDEDEIFANGSSGTPPRPSASRSRPIRSPSRSRRTRATRRACPHHPSQPSRRSAARCRRACARRARRSCSTSRGRRGVPALVLAQAEEVHAALLAFQRGDDCADPSEHALRFPRVDDAIAGGDGHTPLVHACRRRRRRRRRQRRRRRRRRRDAAPVRRAPNALSPADGTTALGDARARRAPRGGERLCRGGADPDRPTARRGAVKAPAPHRGAPRPRGSDRRARGCTRLHRRRGTRRLDGTEHRREGRATPTPSACCSARAPTRRSRRTRGTRRCGAPRRAATPRWSLSSSPTLPSTPTRPTPPA